MVYKKNNSIDYLLLFLAWSFCFIPISILIFEYSLHSTKTFYASDYYFRKDIFTAFFCVLTASFFVLSTISSYVLSKQINYLKVVNSLYVVFYLAMLMWLPNYYANHAIDTFAGALSQYINPFYYIAILSLICSVWFLRYWNMIFSPKSPKWFAFLVCLFNIIVFEMWWFITTALQRA